MGRTWLLLACVGAHLLNFEHAAIFGGVDLGYYYVDLQVGTPPATQTVIIDTGSSLTAFPCAGCESCGKHVDSYFDYKASNTSRLIRCDEGVSCSKCENQHCHYYQGYAEGSSIEGFLIEDFVQFGDDRSADREKLIFGCHSRETNLFKTQLADGIMGLAFSQSSKRMPTIVDVLYKSREISTDVFALCLGQTDGYMTIGGYNASLHNGNIQFAKLYDSVYYAVNVHSLSLGGKKLDLRPADFGNAYSSGTIVDSGTTFVYLTSMVYDRVWTAFANFCGEKNNCIGETVTVPGESHSCYRHSHGTFEDFMSSFPVIKFEIDNVTVVWEQYRYLFSWPDHPNDYCLGVYNNGGGGNVLGGIFMRGLDVVFDRNTDTIGFAPADCNASALLAGDDRRDMIPPPPVNNDTRSGAGEDDKGKWLLLWALILGVAVVLCISAICVLVYHRNKSTRHVEMAEAPASWKAVVQST